MQVRKFEAPTMGEALKLIKLELGPDAIILSTKNHKKGFGLLSKASVEVTAAVSDRSLAKKALTEKVLPKNTKTSVDKYPASKQADVYEKFTDHFRKRKNEKDVKLQKQDNSEKRYIDIIDSSEEVSVTRQEPVQQKSPASTNYARNGSFIQEGANHTVRQESNENYKQKSEENSSVAALQEDIENLKVMLEEIKSEQVTLMDSKIPESTSEELTVEFQNLLHNGLDKKYATALVKDISFSLPKEQLRSSELIVESLASSIMDTIKVQDLLNFKNTDSSSSAPRVIVLIGPTGVGKTTTIAKLASLAILQYNLRVGLINLDSYKVAAVDQLGTYAKILNVPFRQTSTTEELDRAIAEFKPLDLVLIDTTGRSQKDSESLVQLKKLIAEFPIIRPILIMSATTRDQELYDIANRFKIFNPSGLIFSKLDEAVTFGCIYNIAVKTGYPMNFFTTGQRVPEDIEVASKERVAGLILDL